MAIFYSKSVWQITGMSFTIFNIVVASLPYVLVPNAEHINICEYSEYFISFLCFAHASLEAVFSLCASAKVESTGVLHCQHSHIFQTWKCRQHIATIYGCLWFLKILISVCPNKRLVSFRPFFIYSFRNYVLIWHKKKCKIVVTLLWK